MFSNQKNANATRNQKKIVNQRVFVCLLRVDGVCMVY